MTATLPRILELSNPIRDYAWGSPTAIPQLLAIPATGRPVAELWMGAHPDSPSRWQAGPDRPGLDELIGGNPEQLLGQAVHERFGARLPFLLKLLAADRALSMQVHPNASQAAAGYQAERAAGVLAGSSTRNYTDPHHKPELAYALGEFEVFCGFRPVEQTAELLAELAVGQLCRYRDLLLGPDGLRTCFTALLTLPEPARGQLLAATLAGCRQLAAAGSKWSAAAAASVLAAEDFPGDIGPVLALLLNHLRLAPGEAIYLGSGTVHAYLRGLCLEVLANSDNVLRCGLTPKHVDVPELLRITDFSPLVQPRWQPQPGPDGTRQFRVPVPDFTLTELQLGQGQAELCRELPYLVLAGEHQVSLDSVESSGTQACELAPWRAAFVAPGESAVRLTGTGRAFTVTADLPD